MQTLEAGAPPSKPSLPVGRDKRCSSANSTPEKTKAHNTEDGHDCANTGAPSNICCPVMHESSAKKAGHNSLQHDLPTPVSSGGDHGHAFTDMAHFKRPSFHDPLSDGRRGGADYGGQEDDAISATGTVPDSAASGPACPIRFLDQHKPEDIAKYFEQHKHELPRSHEICVKRFQDNDASIRELDAKYGNLVAMIQGLGAKHQPMLPTNPKEEDIREVHAAQHGEERLNRRVEEWASAMTESNVAVAGSSALEARPVPPDAKDGAGSELLVNSDEHRMDETEQHPLHETSAVETDAADAEGRASHFARPLKDVRVGESPTRPWGIPIPSQYLAQSVTERTHVSTAQQLTSANETKGKEGKARAAQCPFREKDTKGQYREKPDKQNLAVDDIIECGSLLSPVQPAAELPTPDPPGKNQKNGGDQSKRHDLAGSSPSSSTPINHFVNYGTAFIGNARSIFPDPGSYVNSPPVRGTKFTNHGVMLLGYSLGEEDKRHLLNNLQHTSSVREKAKREDP